MKRRNFLGISGAAALSPLVSRLGDVPGIPGVKSGTKKNKMGQIINIAGYTPTELLNHDLTRPEGPFAQFVYTGHAVETMWMVMFEAIRIKDSKLYTSAAEKFKRHVEVAWDDVYGGVFSHHPRHLMLNIVSLERIIKAGGKVIPV